MTRRMGLLCKVVFPQIWKSGYEIYFQMKHENTGKNFGSCDMRVDRVYIRSFR